MYASKSVMHYHINIIGNETKSNMKWKQSTEKPIQVLYRLKRVVKDGDVEIIMSNTSYQVGKFIKCTLFPSGYGIESEDGKNVSDIAYCEEIIIIK